MRDEICIYLCSQILWSLRTKFNIFFLSKIFYIAFLCKTFYPDKGGVLAIMDTNLNTKFHSLSMKSKGEIKPDF